MADLFPVAGCKFYIGDALATKNSDFVVGDFSAITWQEVDGWSQMGPHGDAAALIATAIINRGRDLKQKGTRNAGSMENIFGNIPTDQGQIDLLAAEATQLNYAFKIELNDMPSGGSTNSERLFVGLVLSAQEQGGEANTIRNFAVTVEINSNVVRVAAT